MSLCIDAVGVSSAASEIYFLIENMTGSTKNIIFHELLERNCEQET